MSHTALIQYSILTRGHTNKWTFRNTCGATLFEYILDHMLLSYVYCPYLPSKTGDIPYPINLNHPPNLDSGLHGMRDELACRKLRMVVNLVHCFCVVIIPSIPLGVVFHTGDTNNEHICTTRKSTLKITTRRSCPDIFLNFEEFRLSLLTPISFLESKKTVFFPESHRYYRNITTRVFIHRAMQRASAR